MERSSQSHDLLVTRVRFHMSHLVPMDDGRPALDGTEASVFGKVGLASESVSIDIIVLCFISVFRFVSTLRGHIAPVYRLTWSADSRLLVSASKDSTVKVWEDLFG